MPTPATQERTFSDVLVVDADPMQTSVLGDIMRDEGLGAVACASALEAVELFNGSSSELSQENRP